MAQKIFASCDSDLNYCTFVLSKGKNKGLMCMKEAFASTVFGRIVPACQQHVHKYEQLFSAPIQQGDNEEEEDDDFEDEFVDEVVERKRKKCPPPPPTLSLASIPKAMDRTTECCICFEAGQEKDPLLLPCGHTVCFSCVITLLRKKVKEKCPVCRQVFKNTDMRRL